MTAGAAVPNPPLDTDASSARLRLRNGPPVTFVR